MLGRLRVADVSAAWHTRAEALLERALDEARSGIDAIPTVTAALQALRIEAGEASEDSMDGYHFPGEDDPTPCTCPPDLIARGGWASTCPLHGRRT